MFNYILRVLYLGCPWKELSIAHGLDGEPEIHYTRVYRQFRRWHDEGCFEVIFANSVFALHDSGLLDTSVVHGDGTATAAKKGGDNLGFSVQKYLKGDKVVAICDRRCNVIAPFIAAPGNQNESPLMVPALTALTAIAKAIGLDLQGSITCTPPTERSATSTAFWSTKRPGPFDTSSSTQAIGGSVTRC